MTDASLINSRKSLRIRATKFLLNYLFYLIFILVFVFFSVSNNQFYSISNISTVLLQSAPYMFLVCGMALVMISGDFDISVGSVAFISVSIGALAIEMGFTNTLLGVLLMFITGSLLGFINGLLITRLNIPAFIVTLGILIGGRGLGLILIAEKGYIFIPDSLTNLSKIKAGPIFIEVIVAVILLAIFQVYLRRSSLGIKIFAIGDNENAAQNVGVNVRRVKLLLFTLSGFFASLGGMIYLTQAGNVHAQFASGWEFTAISMVVIGGISLYGGAGSLVPGALIGIILIIMIDNGLNIIGASPYLYPFIKGLIIFVAIFADSIKNLYRKGL